MSSVEQAHREDTAPGERAAEEMDKRAQRKRRDHKTGFKVFFIVFSGHTFESFTLNYYRHRHLFKFNNIRNVSCPDQFFKRDERSVPGARASRAPVLRPRQQHSDIITLDQGTDSPITEAMDLRKTVKVP